MAGDVNVKKHYIQLDDWAIAYLGFVKCFEKSC